MSITEEFYVDRELASRAAATHVARALRRRLAGQGEAALVVSGGSTPRDCFAALAGMDLDWARVSVTLSDERWVGTDDADSNARMVAETLLTGAASRATLLPLYREGMDIESACPQVAADLRALPLPFACTLLGMGSDGHFASLFPDADRLEAGLDLASTHVCLPVRTAASPHARLSLTLAALLASEEVLLLFFGNEKKAVYTEARKGLGKTPLSALVEQQRCPLRVVWAP